TEEIKARGQVIVGLLHKSVGHLGIFVSGQVAKKEHAQIVSVLQSIEALPPGIYGMQILENEGASGAAEYDVQFIEHRLEDVLSRINRYQRTDERPFEAVAAVSEFNQRAYERVAQPFVRAAVNEPAAKLWRTFHPLRFTRWAISDFNPWLWWLGPAAAAVKARREPLGRDAPLRRAEAAASEVVGATLDYWRDLRDAVSEAAFFQTYGSLLALRPREDGEPRKGRRWSDAPTREPPFVMQILETIGEGGYAEAVGRMAALLRTAGEPLPLAGIEARHAFAVQNLELLPNIELADLRRIEGAQEIIVRHARARALQTQPALVSDPGERERFCLLLERAAAFADERGPWLNDEQRALVERIREALARPLPFIRPRRAVAP
ncbi:MAG: DUF3141 domain-containing protein, partial [Burkholderiales bacterium]